MTGPIENYIDDKYSFLKHQFPKIYNVALGFRYVAISYALLLVILIILSHFFYSSIIEWLVRIMTGWSFLNIVFIAVMIVALDLPVKSLTVEEISERKTPLRYKASMVWGCSLIIVGLVTLYFSNQYKRDYIFKCSNFYLEDSTGIYHIWDDCNYIGIDQNGYPIENNFISKVKGYELNDWNSLCVACKERSDDYESYYYQ